jgi:single-strand DNA-binding protein
MNYAIIAGRVARDPELKTTNSGTAVCSFSVAVDRKYKDAQGKRVADFFAVVAWRNAAEFAARNLYKGQRVVVAGSLETRSYTAQDGGKRNVTELVAEQIEPQEWRQDGQAQPQPMPQMQEVEDDDLPF